MCLSLNLKTKQYPQYLTTGRYISARCRDCECAPLYSDRWAFIRSRGTMNIVNLSRRQTSSDANVSNLTQCGAHAMTHAAINKAGGGRFKLSSFY